MILTRAAPAAGVNTPPNAALIETCAKTTHLANSVSRSERRGFGGAGVASNKMFPRLEMLIIDGARDVVGSDGVY